MSGYGTSPIRRRLTRHELELLDQAVLDVAEAEQPVSVRGIAYRVLTHPLNVEHGLIEKSENDFRKVQRAALRLRRARVLPYSWVADGTRWVIRATTYGGADAAIADLTASYRRDLWRSQSARVEVWSEKDAMASVLSPVTDAWQVGLYVARGFPSETFLYESAMTARDAGRPTLLLQVGDHDASGVLAWEDTQRKLRSFAPEVEWDFRRLAVTEEQIRDLALPTRPQKRTTHAAGWSGGAVEVDAVPSRYLRTILEDAITAVLDSRLLRLERIVEEHERAFLEALPTYGGGGR